jgi:hypothetical protein
MLQRVADLCLDVDAYWEVMETAGCHVSLEYSSWTDK